MMEELMLALEGLKCDKIHRGEARTCHCRINYWVERVIDDLYALEHAILDEEEQT